MAALHGRRMAGSRDRFPLRLFAPRPLALVQAFVRRRPRSALARRSAAARAFARGGGGRRALLRFRSRRRSVQAPLRERRSARAQLGPLSEGAAVTRALVVSPH